MIAIRRGATTRGDAARGGSKFTHRRQSSFGASALAKLPPGRGLRTSVALGRVELDVVNNFFRELVHRRYAKSVVTAGASAPFVSERLLHSRSVPFVEDDEENKRISDDDEANAPEQRKDESDVRTANIPSRLRTKETEREAIMNTLATK